MSRDGLTLEQTHSDGLTIAFNGVSLLGQTLIYGAYAAFFPLAIHLLLRNGLHGRMSRTIFILICLAFFTSSGYWAASVATFFVKIKTYFIDTLPFNQRKIDDITEFLPLCNAIVLLNFAFVDSIVVWRAWTICRDIRKARIALRIAIGFLVLCILCSFGSIALRAIIITYDVHYQASHLEPRPFSDALSLIQNITIGLSLLTNVIATSCIGWRTWSFRRSARNLRSENGKSLLAILIVMVESGFLYCLSTTFTIIAATIQTAHHSLGSIYLPIHTQISGVYPLLVLVIVQQKRTASSTVTVNQSPVVPGSRTKTIDPIAFAPAESSTGPSQPSVGLLSSHDDSRDAGQELTRLHGSERHVRTYQEQV